MALTINQLIRERRKTLNELKRKLKAVDTLQEAQERFLERVLSRKKKLPEAQDLKYLATKLDQMVTAVSAYQRELDKGFVD